MSTQTVVVDVRDDIRTGREPFSKIMNAAAGLQDGQKLLLIAPFEPVPIVSVLAKQGFHHTSHGNPTGDWEVLFARPASSERSEAKQPRPIASSAAGRTQGICEVVDVEARGLEPPLPMVKILEALVSLPLGAKLKARTDRCPIHLYAQLEERGFSAQTEEQPDGSFLTHIVAR